MEQQDIAVIGGTRLPRFLTSKQVGEALGVDRSTLSRWRTQGVGPRVYWLAKSSPRYREDDVLEWLERNAG
jgi:predicted DNA-binding transcriptional regulator AlpA